MLRSEEQWVQSSISPAQAAFCVRSVRGLRKMFLPVFQHAGDTAKLQCGRDELQLVYSKSESKYAIDSGDGGGCAETARIFTLARPRHAWQHTSAVRHVYQRADREKTGAFV